MKWITPNKEKMNWTYGDVRFYGLFMACIGFGIGFCAKGLSF